MMKINTKCVMETCEAISNDKLNCYSVFQVARHYYTHYVYHLNILKT